MMEENQDNLALRPILHKLYPWRNLRVGIALTFAVSTLLLSALLSILAGLVTRQQIHQDISRQMQETARQTADKLDRGMFERYRDIQNAASLLSDHELSSEEKQNLVEMLQRSFTDYSWIGLTDIEGTVLVSTGEILKGVDVSGRPWFVEGLAGPFVGDVHGALLLEPLLPSENGEPLRLVDIAFPVVDEQGQTEGVLGAHLNWAWAKEVHNSLLPSTSIEGESALFILDVNGNVLLGPPDAEEPIATAVHEQIQSGPLEESIIAAWPDGEQYLSGVVQTNGYRDYPGLGWYVLIRQPTSVAFAPARQLSGRLLALGAVFGLAFATFGWALAGRIATPIQTIAAVARRIRSGDTSGKIPQFHSYEEVMTLADALRDLWVHLSNEMDERKAAEAALRQSEARYRSLVESSGVGIWQILPEGQTLYLNPAMRTLLGLESIEELSDKTHHEFFTPESLKTMERHHAQRATGTVSRYEVELIRTDGEKRNVIVHGAPVLTAEGQLHSLIGTFLDITRRKRTEETLRQSELRYRRLFENALVGVFRSTPDGRFLQVNPALVEMLGYDSAADVLALDLPDDLYANASQRALMQAEYEPGGVIKGREVVWKRKDGRQIIVRLHGRVVRDEQGSIHFYEGMVRDITQQKQAEQDLKQAKDFNDAIIDSLPGAFYIINQEGRFLRWNTSVEQVTGYTSQELAGLQPLDLIRPADWDQVAAAIEQTFTEGESYVEAHLLTKDGHAPPYLFTGRRILIDEGPALLGLGIDITDRKQAEEQVRRSEANLRAIFKNTLQAFVLFDAERRVLAANPVANTWASQILGRPLPEGELADELFAQFQFENFQQLFNQALQGETITQERKITVGNQSFWFESNYNPVTTEEEDVVGVSLSVLNITGRKQVEEALRQSKTELQHIIDTVPEGVLLLAADESIHLTNPVADRFLKTLAPDWETGRLTRLGNRPLHELLTSPPKGLWHEIATDDLVFEAIARPVEDSPDNGGWVLVLRDITQERHIQRRVQQQERLAAVGQLAAGIAHDFNNILAVIALHAQLILHNVSMSERHQERLHIIEQQTSRAADLIHQILDFSRQSVLERQPLDLLPFMEELVKLLDRTLPEHIQIDLVHAAGEYLISADPSRMQQVIMNLAVNARDAMPEGGRLKISLRHVRTETLKPMPMRDMPPGNWVQIQVADSGEGIPPKVLPNIFDPFFTTKKVGQGNGLGLAQVYGIVQQHDGYIDVATTVGQGAEFILYIPALNTGEEAWKTPDRTEVQSGQGQRILLVEDNPAARKALGDSLTMLNYEVTEAANGREALAILDTKAEELDLVLSDFVMPEMGGSALFHAMRRKNLSIPVVLLTGHPLSKEMEILQAQGLTGWLPKPLDLATLSQLLAKVLNKESHRDQG